MAVAGGLIIDPIFKVNLGGVVLAVLANKLVMVMTRDVTPKSHEQLNPEVTT